MRTLLTLDRNSFEVLSVTVLNAVGDPVDALTGLTLQQALEQGVIADGGTVETHFV